MGLGIYTHTIGNITGHHHGKRCEERAKVAIGSETHQPAGLRTGAGDGRRGLPIGQERFRNRGRAARCLGGELRGETRDDKNARRSQGRAGLVMTRKRIVLSKKALGRFRTEADIRPSGRHMPRIR